MNRIIKSLVALLALSLVFTACGGGGGGGDAATGGSGAATGTFTKQIAVAAGANNFTFPFNVDYDQKTQNLYTAAEIGGSGKITTIRVHQSNAMSAAVTCPNTTIKMGHTNNTSMTTTWANNVNTGQGAERIVLNNATITIPLAAAGSWIDIPLATPFEYNGVDNLVVDFERTTKCTATVDTTHYSSTDRRAYGTALDNTAGVADYHPITANGVDAALPWIQFVFSGGDNYFVPTTGVATPNIWPFNINPLQGRKVQMLYTKDEINGSGPITGIGFPVASVTTAQQYTVTIRLGHFTLTQLGTTFANNLSSTPVTVANNVVFTVPAGVPVGGFVWLPLPNGAFTYNGTDSLVMEIEVTDNSSATSSVDWLINTAYGRNVKLGGNLGAVTGSVNQYAHYAKFRFNGGTMDVITSGANVLGEPFWNLENKIQFLYDASSLGTKGTISKVAFRLRYDAVASSYLNFTVALGHTTRTALSATYADNMDDRRVVFNDTLSIPGTLKAGDWVEIPFSTPFTYDSAKNLTIEASGLGGGVNYILTQEDASRYLQHGRYSTGAGSIIDPAANFVLDRDADLRFWIQ